MLAMSDLSKPTLPCNGVRCSVVWPELFFARPTAASSSGLLVMASMRAFGLAALDTLAHDHDTAFLAPAQ